MVVLDKARPIVCLRTFTIVLLEIGATAYYSRILQMKFSTISDFFLGLTSCKN